MKLVLGVNFFNAHFIVNNFLLYRFTDYIQILVEHSRGVFNFMGIILVAQVSFILLIFRFYAFFSKISVRFWPFSNPAVVNEISIKKALNANECVR